ncbi:MAG: 4-hydroxy-3-methylbut-2-enyl diphosphate reductase, partial [Clostridia bacterium]|nr:4-hydroxy-3-methylbut-2-enyl diphosphate reductase [Clostridia bacterium]
MADIKISEYSGFCFGVKRAVDMINQYIDNSNRRIYCLGELIHNRLFTQTLRERGVCFIEPDQINELPSDALLFVRTHGTTK